LKQFGVHSQFGSSFGLSVPFSAGFGLVVSSLGVAGFSAWVEVSGPAGEGVAGSSAKAKPAFNTNAVAIAKDTLRAFFILSPWCFLAPPWAGLDFAIATSISRANL
jgi:hypothetical protein